MNERGKTPLGGHGVDEPRTPNDERLAANQDQIRTAAVKELTLPATIESVTQAIGFLRDSLRELGHPPKVQTKFIVMVDEIFSNIAKFAYGTSGGYVTIRISEERKGEAVEMFVIDEGAAFNPLERPPVDTKAAIANRQIGGQGIFIVRSLADEVGYERKDGKNVFCIRVFIER